MDALRSVIAPLVTGAGLLTCAPVQVVLRRRAGQDVPPPGPGSP